MSGPKRNPDKLNTIGIVVVGICGAVLVYVTIVALQAFYVNDTSDVQNTADYGGQDTSSKSLRAAQTGSINEFKPNAKPAEPKAGETAKPQSYRMPIELAMKKVVEEGKTDQSNLIPAVGPSNKPTVIPVYGRPKPLGAAPAAAPANDGAGSAAPAAQPAKDVTPTPVVPTGAGTGPSPVNGAGSLDAPSHNPPPKAGTPAQPAAPAVAPANPTTPAPKGNGK